MKTKICKNEYHVGEGKLLITEFRNNKKAKDGKAASCKVCADRMSATSNAKRPGHKYRVAKLRRKNMILEWRQWKQQQGCMCCSETEAVCLELHHLDPTEKEENLSDIVRRGWSWERVMKEAAKCVVLCANCHRKVHADIINLDDYK